MTRRPALTHRSGRIPEVDFEAAHGADDGDDGLDGVAIDHGLVLLTFILRVSCLVDNPGGEEGVYNEKALRGSPQFTWERVFTWTLAQRCLPFTHTLYLHTNLLVTYRDMVPDYRTHKNVGKKGNGQQAFTS